MIQSTINYKRIYSDILDLKYPEKKQVCQIILNKEKLLAMDIIELNKRIFGISDDAQSFNRRHKAYNQSSILHILDYQKKNMLNDSEVAKYFKLSRSTLRLWKRKYTI
ncbi:helix-turn-helix domain-containing protein [Chryseobacterium nematophagum]|uniref:Helix-turn-helix domain-containing protein n=1 Tax=Chryseobacterium nematophagum TaxID=2305228 RepID=A0A3M7TJR4_9FLAO|nr:helix-turn-helix domain-containing protein [Chryseobacterium nematophagum]RNA63344.1 helix-turn-helix domain-containing protein [Chryseobacterium nematophagum]